MGLRSENYRPSCADWWGGTVPHVVVCDLRIRLPAALGFSPLPIFQGVPGPWIFVLPLAVAVPRDGTQLEKLPSLDGNSVHHNRGTRCCMGYSGHTQHFHPCLSEYVFLPP